MKICLNREKLRDLRKEQKLTQQSLAENADMSERYVRALELGTKNRPTAEVLCKIAMSLDTSMDDLLMVVSDNER